MIVDCNRCGASLTVAEDTRFVTCGKCRARLAVRRNGDAIFTEVLAEESAEHATSHDPVVPSTPIVVSSGGGESALRIVVGGLVVASDIYWWMTDPTMQSLYVRIGLLAAGAWLILSGVWKAMANARARLHAQRDVEAASGRARTPPQK